MDPDTDRSRRRRVIAAIIVATAMGLLLIVYVVGVAYLAGQPRRPPPSMTTVPPAVLSPPSPRSTDWEDMAVIEGRVIAAAGEPLPLAIHVATHSERGIRSWHVFKQVKESAFGLRVQPGKVRVTVRAQGYAPVLLGPWTLDERDTVADVLVRLERGFDGRIELTSDSGDTPASGTVEARVVGILLHDLSIDSAGRAVFPHCGDVPLDLAVRADGFEQTWFTQVRLERKNPLPLRLKPARPAHGTVVSAATGAPVAGARFRFLEGLLVPGGARDGGLSGHSTEPGDGHVWAASDGRGHVRLTSCRGDWAYWFHLKANGFAPAIVGPFRAGEDFGPIRLIPPIEVSGEIRGPAQALQRLSASWRQPFTITYRGMQQGHDCPGDTLRPIVEDGRIPFRIKGLRAGEFILSVDYQTEGLQNREFKTDLTESIRGLVIAPEGVQIEVTTKPATRPASSAGDADGDAADREGRALQDGSRTRWTP